MPAVVDLRTEGAACSRRGYEEVAMLWSVKSERDERQGLRSTIELLRVPRAPEYDVITNLDSQTAATSLQVLVLRWLPPQLPSWEVFVVASATCALGVIFSGDFAESRPRYLQSTASATPRRYFASTSAYFSSMRSCFACETSRRVPARQEEEGASTS